MNHVAEKLFNIGTYGLTISGIVVNFESIKSVILFGMAFILLTLQIVLHIIKIKNERKNK